MCLSVVVIVCMVVTGVGKILFFKVGGRGSLEYLVAWSNICCIFANLR